MEMQELPQTPDPSSQNAASAGPSADEDCRCPPARGRYMVGGIVGALLVTVVVGGLFLGWYLGQTVENRPGSVPVRFAPDLPVAQGDWTVVLAKIPLHRPGAETEAWAIAEQARGKGIPAEVSLAIPEGTASPEGWVVWSGAYVDETAAQAERLSVQQLGFAAADCREVQR